jgi:drug/metabolite transporter (DMT)-like permease
VKPAAIIGIILIVIGIVGFVWGGVGWNEQKKDAQLGPLQITHQEEHGISVPPLVSDICLVGGIVLVGIGARKG